MLPRIAFHSRCIVTLVAFEPFFSRVNFHMSPQIAFHGRCIVTLIACEWFILRVSFHMSSPIAGLSRGVIALVAFEQFFPEWILMKCFLKSAAWSAVNSHWLHVNACSAEWVSKSSPEWVSICIPNMPTRFDTKLSWFSVFCSSALPNWRDGEFILVTNHQLSIFGDWPFFFIYSLLLSFNVYLTLKSGQW